MKHIIYPLFILFLIFSCENSFSPDLEEIDPVSGNLNEIFFPFNYTNPEEVIAFENQMQWISYLTAKAILQENDARQDFLQAFRDHGFIHNGSITLNLQDLLNFIPDANANNDDNSSFRSRSTVNYEAFNLIFKKLFIQYQESNPHDCQNTRTSGLGGDPRPLNPAGGSDEDEIFTPYYQFISEITNVQCLQLYLPFGLNDRSTTIRSSAHPLNDELSNISYEHEVAPCFVTANIISNLDGIDTPNLIITRPYRFGLGHGCTYFDFDFNFENFMNVNN